MVIFQGVISQPLNQMRYSLYFEATTMVLEKIKKDKKLILATCTLWWPIS